jgi:hypothetical protein
MQSFALFLRLFMAAMCAFSVFAAQAGSISPSSLDATLDVNDSLTIHKTITVDADPSFIDLVFGSTFTGSGLDLVFTCMDALGCTNVGALQSRAFDLTITGLLAGVYDFDVFSLGVNAIERDHVVVGEVPGPGNGIPEPRTYALMLTSLVLLGAVSRRRRPYTEPAIRRRSSSRFAPFLFPPHLALRKFMPL